jgi:hypothetical protein
VLGIRGHRENCDVICQSSGYELSLRCRMSSLTFARVASAPLTNAPTIEPAIAISARNAGLLTSEAVNEWCNDPGVGRIVHVVHVATTRKPLLGRISVSMICVALKTSASKLNLREQGVQVESASVSCIARPLAECLADTLLLSQSEVKSPVGRSKSAASTRAVGRSGLELLMALAVAGRPATAARARALAGRAVVCRTRPLMGLWN